MTKEKKKSQGTGKMSSYDLFKKGGRVSDPWTSAEEMFEIYKKEKEKIRKIKEIIKKGEGEPLK